MATEGTERGRLLPEWRDGDVDDAAWVEAIEASWRDQFAELADL